MLRRLLMLLALLPVGCSDDDAVDPAPIDPNNCAASARMLDDGSCVVAGLRADAPCPPGEWARDGRCLPAGVPPDGCGEGFSHDGDRGCVAVLPAAACPDGQMALPGEMSCRDIAPCGSGSWGDIVIDSSSQHVDANYGGMNSDGSASAPWTTIGEAISAAADGATIAIAAGSYDEDVLIDKPLVLWGRCPSLVAIVGTGLEAAAVRVFPDADGTALRSLAITGGSAGFVVVGSRDVELDRVWVHDNVSRGVSAQDNPGPTSITLRDSLVERAGGHGVRISGADALIEDSVVRSTRPIFGGDVGRGISAEVGATSAVPASMVVDHTVIRDNGDVGLFVYGSRATISATLVRDTKSIDGEGGRGVDAGYAIAPLDVPSELVMRTSVIERHLELGLHVGSSIATVEDSVVRDVAPDAQGYFGHGVDVTANIAPSTLDLRRSLVDNSSGAGIFMSGTVATIHAVASRRTQRNAELFSRGFQIQTASAAGRRSTVSIDASVMEGNVIGVYADNSDLTVSDSLVRDMRTHPDDPGGRGIGVGGDGGNATLTVRGVLIDDATDAGIFAFDAHAAIEHCLVQNTRGSDEALLGDGIALVSTFAMANATMTATRIVDSARAGVSSFGGAVSLGGNELSCQSFDLVGVDYTGGSFEFNDLGGNGCGCPNATEPCERTGSGLDAPEPIGGLE